MALTIVVQDIVHAEISRYTDDPAGTLQRLCSSRPETSLLRGVDPHADTMLNAYQLGRVVAEIDALLAARPPRTRSSGRGCAMPRWRRSTIGATCGSAETENTVPRSLPLILVRAEVP